MNHRYSLLGGLQFASAEGDQETPGTTNSVWQILTHPDVFMSLLAGSFAWGLMLLLTAPFTATVTAILGMKLEHAAHVLAFHDVCMMLPSVLTEHLISKWGGRVAIVCGQVLYVIAYTLLPFIIMLSRTHQLVLWFWMAIFGFGWNLLWLGSTSLLTDAKQAYISEEAAFDKAMSIYETVVNGNNVLFLGLTLLIKPWKHEHFLAGAAFLVLSTAIIRSFRHVDRVPPGSRV